MVLKPSVNEEELLQVLNDPTTPETSVRELIDLKYPTLDREVISFIEEFNITDGPNKVYTNQISKLYNQWSKSKLPNIVFIKTFVQYFPSQNQYVLLNIDKLNLSKKVLAAVRRRVSQKTYQKYIKQFDKYLKYYNISFGKTKVTAKVIYYLYKKWVYKNYIDKVIPFPSFCMLLGLYCHKKRHYYYVSSNINKLVSKQEREDLKNIDREIRRKQKEKNKKKQSKISSIGEKI